METPEKIVKGITKCFTGNGDYFFEYVTPEDCLKAINQALRIHDVVGLSEQYCVCGKAHGMHDIDNNYCDNCEKKIFP